MSIILTDDELEALMGITDYQFRLYVQGIRPYMDYATGIVGIKRKISLSSLASETYIEKIKGVKQTGNKSRFQVHRAIKQLEKAGLLKVKSIATAKEKHLILECLLALTDKSKQNKAATWPQHSLAQYVATVETKENPIKTDDFSNSDNKVSTVGRTPRIEKPATYPLSVNTNNTTRDDEKFLSTMPDNSMLSPFVNLLGKNFAHHHICNIKTMGMIRRWVKAGVTVEHAQAGIESIDAVNKPDHPTYYEKAVLKAKAEFEKPISEVNHATSEPNRAAKPKREYVDHGAEAKRQLAEFNAEIEREREYSETV
jgi:hypothetical protein